MSRAPLGAVVLAVAAAVASAPIEADAGRVRCPVCGQVFDDSVELCPNDGTDLSLVGERIEEPAKEAAEEGEEEREGARSEGPPRSRYKRHDVNGRRRRKAEEREPEYTDRQRRIGGDRRSGSAQADAKRRERERIRMEMEERDAALRAEFGARRDELFEEARRREERERLDAMLAASQRERNERFAPVTSVGARLSWMREGNDSGLVAGAEIDFNPVARHLRLGLSTFVGVRSLEERGELVFMENLSVGFQWPWRYSPFAAVRGGIGALVADRFGEDVFFLVWSVGGEVGLDCWVSSDVVISPSAGYVRYMVKEAYWDSFTAKVSIGF